MPAPTVSVTCTASDQSGYPVSGALYTARLNSTEIYQGFVVPEIVRAKADVLGVCVLELWPNALGVAGSLYNVTAVNPDTGKTFLRTTAYVPNSPCNLHQILLEEPYPALNAAAQALISVQATLALTVEQAVLADNDRVAAEIAAAQALTRSAAASLSQFNAAISESQAEDAEIAAEDSRDAIDSRLYPGVYLADPATRPNGSARQAGDEYFNGTTNRKRIFAVGVWMDYEAAAAASAVIATTQAGIALVQANAATTNGAAQVSLAATQAGLATTNGAAQVALATTQANAATTNGAAQVALATTQANAATTNGAAQVALATTQANAATTNGAAQVALAVTQANAATNQAGLSATAKTAAEAARDAAFVASPVKYTTETLGRAAVTDGINFLVQGSADVAALEYRRTDSSTSVLIASYPSSDAVLKPRQTGKKNGWPDPFFRRPTTLSGDFLGRKRLTTLSGVAYLTGFSLVPNTIFDGQALRRAANLVTASYGASAKIWLDELGALAGDTITVYTLFVGDGAVINGTGRFASGAADVGSPIVPVNSVGGATITASGAPQWLQHTQVVPAGADAFYTYPYTSTADKTFDIVAMWAFKGAANLGPNWPVLDGTPAALSALTLAEDRVTSIEATTVPATGFAVDSSTLVTAASTAVVADATGISANPRDLVFTGWAEKFSPAGGSFNAVRCKLISRTAALATSQWRTLNIVIRTGAGSSNVGATVVAVGTATVLESSSTLVDVTVLLRDPITNVLKTVSDASFSAGEYFVGIYAFNKAGAAAACGEPRGTVANNLGQSYYITSSGGSPKTAAWTATAGASNFRMGFVHLMLTSPVESVAFSPAQTFINALGTMSAIPVPSIIAPPFIYGVQGRECNVYQDNLHYGDSSEYLHDFAASYGIQQRGRWTWTPAAALASGTLVYTAYDKRTGTSLVSGTSQLRAAASTAGTGMNKKTMVIGDSWVNAGTITQTLLDIAGADAMGITFYGTRGTGLNKHEGRGGYTVNDYCTVGRTYFSFTVSGVVVAPAINSTKYSNNGTVFTVQETALTGGAGTLICSVDSGTVPAASGTLTKVSGAGDASIAFSASAAVSGNPFWISGAVNFPQYLTNSAIPALDWVFIALGVNDCFGQTDDAACTALADSELSKLDTLIASIKASNAATKMALVLPGPGAGQDGFGANYAAGQTAWRYKRNISIWSARLIAKYSAQEAARIYLAPANTALDTVNNMPIAAATPVNSRNSATVVLQNNGVHPDTSGYQQIGDALWAFLKFYA